VTALREAEVSCRIASRIKTLGIVEHIGSRFAAASEIRPTPSLMSVFPTSTSSSAVRARVRAG